MTIVASARSPSSVTTIRRAPVGAALAKPSGERTLV